MKKTLALALALCMVFSFCAVAAHAEEPYHFEMLVKSFQSSYWQAAVKGIEQEAAAKFPTLLEVFALHVFVNRQLSTSGQITDPVLIALAVYSDAFIVHVTQPDIAQFRHTASSRDKNLNQSSFLFVFTIRSDLLKLKAGESFFDCLPGFHSCYPAHRVPINQFFVMHPAEE